MFGQFFFEYCNLKYIIKILMLEIKELLNIKECYFKKILEK